MIPTYAVQAQSSEFQSITNKLANTTTDRSIGCAPIAHGQVMLDVLPIITAGISTHISFRGSLQSLGYPLQSHSRILRLRILLNYDVETMHTVKPANIAWVRQVGDGTAIETFAEPFEQKTKTVVKRVSVQLISTTLDAAYE